MNEDTPRRVAPGAAQPVAHDGDIPHAVSRRLGRPLVALRVGVLHVGALLVVALLAACRPPTPDAARADAPRLTGLGSHSMPVSTREPEAQRLFDQGLVLGFGFDFELAEQSFRAALARDPACALCAWGVAWSIGPNINQPERGPRMDEAREITRRALVLAAQATPREQGLIEALALRYEVGTGAASAASVPGTSAATGARSTGPDPKLAPPDVRCVTRAPTGETDPRDLAYAQAMARLAARFPADEDLATLHAEAVLMLAPWDWWSGGQPREGTLLAVETLEAVLARNPRHPGANHYLIHALEGSPMPERALAASGRLPALAPDVGHLVHMPSHIHLRLGRYADAVRANQAAIAADERLDAQLRAQGYAVRGVAEHHHHFLWAAAVRADDAVTALEAARALAGRAREPAVPRHGLSGRADDGTREYYAALPLQTLVRFARWDEVLAWPEPAAASTVDGADAQAFERALRHWARAHALRARGDAAGARQEAKALHGAAAVPALKTRLVKGIDPLADLLDLAEAQLLAALALDQGRRGQARALAQRAAEREAALDAHEPPLWALPSAALLARAGAASPPGTTAR